jgi:uncharacterized repeat protein (TIGR03803 family)
MEKYASFRIILLMLVFGLAVAIAAPAQTYQVVTAFSGTNGAPAPGGLLLGTDGNFYGMTSAGGLTNSSCSQGGCGTFFQLTPSGTLTTLYNFCSLTNCADGSRPVGLVQGTDGNFYGTTYFGGLNQVVGVCNDGCGTVFQLTPGGVLTTLYNFCSLANCADGGLPGGLLQGTDGNFYGTNGFGGDTLSTCTDGCGTVFQLTPSGVLTTLYNFCTLVGCPGAPYSPGAGNLIQGTDGNFYGLTYHGGSVPCVDGGCGTAFQLTPSGVYTTLYNFCSLPNCADGQNPLGMLQGADGNFYGATAGGGAAGTVFQLTPGGVLTRLYNFCSLADCADGAYPYSAPVMGADGNLYGTTEWGGVRPGHAFKDNCAFDWMKTEIGCGTFYQLTLSGTLTTLHAFCNGKLNATYCENDGANPRAGVVQAADGSFYGTTEGAIEIAGVTRGATVFRWWNNVSLDPTFTPTSLTFTKQTVGTTSKAKSVAIKNANTDTATLDLTGFTISGPFAITANKCSTLVAGKSCKVSITFTPTATGTATGTLTISDNTPNSPQTVTLTGTGK